jgi:tetratricopeptide (TPR) repeat protein
MWIFRCRRPWILVAAAVLSLALVGSCSSEPRSLVLVTVSGLRADAVDRATTPNLADLGEKGTRVELHAPALESVPALGALLTGRSPQKMGLRHSDTSRVPPTATSLAEKLSESGYRSAAFVGDGMITARSGLARGFGDFLSPGRVVDQALLPQERRRAKPASGGMIKISRLEELAGAFLRDASGDRAFFLWVHVPELEMAASQQDARAAYQAKLRRVDGVVSYLLQTLDSFGLRDRTVLAVASPYGMALGDGGEQRHGLTLSPSVVRVPLLLSREVTSAPAPDGAPASLTRGFDMLSEAVGLAATTRQSNAGPVLTTTHLPTRLYDWPPRGQAGSSEGWLELSPLPVWRPSDGDAVDGMEGWEQAPASLRAALAAAGLEPSAAREGGLTRDPAPGDDVLPTMRAAHQSLLRRDPEGALRDLAPLFERLPGAIAPRELALRALDALDTDEHQGGVSREDLLDQLESRPTGTFAQELDAARLLIRHERESAGLARLRALAETSAQAAPGQRLALAQRFADAGAFEEALEQVGAVAQTDPEAPAIQEWRGDLLMRTGNAYRALEALEKAFENERARTPNLMAKLGDAMAALGRNEEALKRYARAVSEDASYLYPHARAARVFLAEGREGEAADALVKSLPKLEDPVEEALLKARTLHREGLVGPAIVELRRAVDRFPDQTSLRVSLARLYQEAGKLDRARELIESWRASDPESAAPLVERARLEALAGQPDRAVEWLKKAEPLAEPELAGAVRSTTIFTGPRANDALRRTAREFAITR